MKTWNMIDSMDVLHAVTILRIYILIGALYMYVCVCVFVYQI